jgi:hypothetical protein
MVRQTWITAYEGQGRQSRAPGSDQVVRGGLKDEFTRLRMYNTRIGGEIYLSIACQAIVRASVVDLLA